MSDIDSIRYSIGQELHKQAEIINEGYESPVRVLFDIFKDIESKATENGINIYTDPSIQHNFKHFIKIISYRENQFLYPNIINHIMNKSISNNTSNLIDLDNSDYRDNIPVTVIQSPRALKTYFKYLNHFNSTELNSKSIAHIMNEIINHINNYNYDNVTKSLNIVLDNYYKFNKEITINDNKLGYNTFDRLYHFFFTNINYRSDLLKSVILGRDELKVMYLANNSNVNEVLYSSDTNFTKKQLDKLISLNKSLSSYHNTVLKNIINSKSYELLDFVLTHTKFNKDIIYFISKQDTDIRAIIMPKITSRLNKDSKAKFDFLTAYKNSRASVKEKLLVKDSCNNDTAYKPTLL